MWASHNVVNDSVQFKQNNFSKYSQLPELTRTQHFLSCYWRKDRWMDRVSAEMQTYQQRLRKTSQNLTVANSYFQNG
jgi:hypothetical protein